MLAHRNIEELELEEEDEELLLKAVLSRPLMLNPEGGDH